MPCGVWPTSALIMAMVAGEDIFGGGTGVGGSMSATAINVAKEALACMPIMDVEFMWRKREELSDNDAGK